MTQDREISRLFKDVENLLYEGRCEEALQLVRGIETRQLEKTDTLKRDVLESKCLTKLGEFDASLQMSYRTLDECRKTLGCQWIEIDALITMAESMWRLGQLDKSYETIEEGEQNLQTLVLQILPVHTLINTEVTARRGALLYHKGTVCLLRSDFDHALEFYQESLALYEKIDYKQEIAAALNVLGVVYNQRGELDRALEFYRRSLVLKKEIGNELDIAKALNNIGTIYYDQGELDAALAHYQQSLALREKLGNKQDIAHSFNNIGEVYFQRGDLDEALEYFQKSLTLLEEISNKQGVAHIFKNIGEVHFRKGDSDRALENFHRSLKLREELDNTRELSETLFHMFFVALDNGTIEQAQQFLIRHQQINEQEEIKIVDQRQRVAKALILKVSMRARDRAKAEELLEQVVEEDIIAHELTVIALLSLCDLLLIDYRISGDAEVLESVQSNLNRVLQIASDQNSFGLLAEAQVLHSKLALLDLDVETARQLLTRAQLIANEKGLDKLAVKISNEHDVLLDELDKWEELARRQAPLAERTEMARIDDQLEIMLRQGVEEGPVMPEEEPIMLMILAKEGLVVFSKTFGSLDEIDDSMVGELFDAFQSFGEEIFSQVLDRIKLKTYTVLIKHIDSLAMCYVYNGHTYPAQRKLVRFIEVVSQNPSVWNAMLENADTGQTLDPRARESLESFLNEVFTS